MATVPELPRLVRDAEERAARAGFTLSCEPLVGQLLACLVAGLPRHARVLEIGTGMGVGLAWIVTGLSGRTDVEVVTVERDRECMDAVGAAQWPPWVQRVTGDAEDLLPGLGRFALVFADAEGGKWTRLDLTLDALDIPGMLLVDDMDLDRYEDSDHRAMVSNVRSILHSDPRLVTVEMQVASGIILATRRAERHG